MKLGKVTRSAFEQAQALYRKGKHDQARQLCLQVLVMSPNHREALSLLGKLELKAGRLDAAVKALERAVEIDPKSSIDLCNLGAAYHRLGLLDRALETLARSVKLDPKRADALFNLGLVSLDRGDSERGVMFLNRAAELNPDSIAIQHALGKELLQLNRTTEAVTCFRRAVRLDPDSLDLSLKLLSALEKGELFVEVEELARRLASKHPSSFVVHAKLGRALSKLHRFSEAVDTFQKLLLAEPDNASTASLLGFALAKLGRLDEALEQFERAVRVNPALALEHASIVFHAGFSPRYDSERLLAEARRWNAVHAGPLAQRQKPHLQSRDPERRLRVAYVSPDFRAHVQRLFTVPVFRNHDHSRYEIVCYSSVVSPDPWTQEIKGCADEWHDVARLSDSELARKIRDDRIDVAVDLTMHMAGCRLRAFAERPAPVQLSWLAYPGTTGVDGIDYRITDPFLDPPGAPLPYSERSLWMPDSFWCFDPIGDVTPVTELPMKTAGHITFGCLNNFMKVNREVLVLWARVLSTIPNSRLLLLAPQGWSRNFVTDVLNAQGIVSERLEFVGLQGRQHYLAAYNRIDVALDTFPYNGHTTSLDAFSMGVPVITLVGQTIVGRAGLCMASNLGLADELVAHNADQFVERALRLCSDPEALDSLRQELPNRLRKSPLMDAQKFTHNLEGLYREAWRHWCKEPSST